MKMYFWCDRYKCYEIRRHKETLFGHKCCLFGPSYCANGARLPTPAEVTHLYDNNILPFLKNDSYHDTVVKIKDSTYAFLASQYYSRGREHFRDYGVREHHFVNDTFIERHVTHKICVKESQENKIIISENLFVFSYVTIFVFFLIVFSCLLLWCFSFYDTSKRRRERIRRRRQNHDETLVAVQGASRHEVNNNECDIYYSY